MTNLEHLHNLVVQQQAALHVGDLSWFQELVQQRMGVQQLLVDAGTEELTPQKALVADIVRLDLSMEASLREMADQTLTQLRELATRERQVGQYRGGLDRQARFVEEGA